MASDSHIRVGLPCSTSPNNKLGSSARNYRQKCCTSRYKHAIEEKKEEEETFTCLDTCSEKMSSTPSPTASGQSAQENTPATSTTSSNNGSASNPQSRRPPRKSTLTQQQKNQKRQRATQDQLGLLEIEFNKNPTPTAAVRERIAEEINMTERSVQIWFQNR